MLMFVSICFHSKPPKNDDLFHSNPWFSYIFMHQKRSPRTWDQNPMTEASTDPTHLQKPGRQGAAQRCRRFRREIQKGDSEVIKNMGCTSTWDLLLFQLTIIYRRLQKMIWMRCIYHLLFFLIFWKDGYKMINAYHFENWCGYCLFFIKCIFWKMIWRYKMHFDRSEKSGCGKMARFLRSGRGRHLEKHRRLGRAIDDKP